MCAAANVTVTFHVTVVLIFCCVSCHRFQLSMPPALGHQGVNPVTSALSATGLVTSQGLLLSSGDGPLIRFKRAKWLQNWCSNTNEAWMCIMCFPCPQREHSLNEILTYCRQGTFDEKGLGSHTSHFGSARPCAQYFPPAEGLDLPHPASRSPSMFSLPGLVWAGLGNISFFDCTLRSLPPQL